MINFVCTHPAQVAMETMHLFHSAKEFIFEDKNSLHFMGPDEVCPNEQFGTHKICPGVQCR